MPDTARQLGPEDSWDGFDVPFDDEEITVVVELVDFVGDEADECIELRASSSSSLSNALRTVS